MSEHTSKPTVGALPDATVDSPFVPVALTWLAWSLFAASVVALVARFRFGSAWEVPGLVAVDGLTVLLWVVVTFFSGIIHSYSRRYMAGSARETSFFATVFGFTVTVMALVAADHVALFWLLWLAMGLLMATLIGTASGWKQARAAANVARTHFLASSALLGVALTALWWATGETTVSGIAAAADGLGGAVWLVAVAALVLAAMIQSALVPFHTWLLSSMTAPTPASALMHAGFVNAGGILLVRFGPVVTVEPGFMFLVVLVGAASALGGKLLKTVQTDVKGKLGCSTVGQMGFMIAQVGLGFFAAAVAHLILHGFYKAYQFLGSGEQVAHEHPEADKSTGSTGALGVAVVVATALAGGVVFAALTGKGTSVDSGLLLTLLVILTVMHAARELVAQESLPGALRYGAVPAVALPAIAVYAAVYRGIAGLLSGPVAGQPAELTLGHALVGVAFLAAYVAVERGLYQRSQRLYVALLNAGQPSTDTQLTTTEEYNEY